MWTSGLRLIRGKYQFTQCTENAPAKPGDIGSQLLDSLSRTQLPGRPQAALETIYMEGAMTNSRLSPKCSNRNQPQSGPPALAQTPAQNPAPLSAAQDAHMRASSKPSRHA
jgi:hypothetical protein